MLNQKTKPKKVHIPLFIIIMVNYQSAMKSRLEEDDDDEDHGGLVKKIMETKKEYEQTRTTEIVSRSDNKAKCQVCMNYC